MTLSVAHILVALLALAGGAGSVGAVIAAGVLTRWIRPAIREEIRTHEGEAATVEARRATIRGVVDDQVRRDDGVIREHTRESSTRTDAEMRELRATLGAVLDELAQLRGMLSAYLDGVGPRRPPEALSVPARRSQVAVQELIHRHPPDPTRPR